MVVVVMVRNESLLDFDSDVNDPCDEGVVKRSLFHVAGGGGGGGGRHSSFRMVGRKKWIRKKATGFGRGQAREWMVVITCMGCSLGSPRGGRGVEWS